MKHIVEKYDQNLFKSTVWDFYFEGRTVGVLDIETTGLDPSRTEFILGCLYNCRTNELHQVLAENRKEEAEALCEYLEELADVDVVITYNGRHFDMPFLEKRLRVLMDRGEITGSRWEIILKRLYDLDLYLVVSGHSPIKSLVPNLRQKTLENYMGFWDTRTDEISGAESVELYDHYEKTGDEEAEARILLHNNDDVRQLTKLTKVIGKCDIHKAMCRLGFPVGDLITGKPSINKDHLLIQGVQTPSEAGFIDYRGYSLGDYPAETKFSARDKSFEFRIPVVRNMGLTVIDLQAAGLCTDDFDRYPTCESGFLIIEDHGKMKHMEINHFTRAFIRKFQEEAL